MQSAFVLHPLILWEIIVSVASAIFVYLTVDVCAMRYGVCYLKPPVEVPVKINPE